jgi:hypothetical protein
MVIKDVDREMAWRKSIALLESHAGPFDAFRGKADINKPDNCAEFVENDIVDDARSRHRMCQKGDR